jgi:hypothetical protein
MEFLVMQLAGFDQEKMSWVYVEFMIIQLIGLNWINNYFG